MDKLKLKFFCYHLAFSSLIVTTLCFVCLLIWFPSPFLTLDGTWVALFILAICDIIIGPLFTILLVSSKKSPKENVIDLALILVIQFSALGYGLSHITQERLFALIYLNGAFSPIPIKEIENYNQRTALLLPKYQGIYYGTSTPSLTTMNNEIPLLFSTENYKALSTEVLGDSEFLYNQLPLKIQSTYSDDYIFKVLPGKQAVGVVVIDQKLNIKDIILLNEDTD